MIVEKIEITKYDTPWEIACMLIDAEYAIYEVTDMFDKKVVDRFFDLEDLLRIGEHLVNYCNTEKERGVRNE